MNYLKHYLNLIRKAEKRGEVVGYKEKHHVFPISIFGANNRTVELTGREHFVAHMLLFLGCRKRYGIYHYKTKKMAFAAQQMGWKVGERPTPSRIIEIARRFASWSNLGDNNPSKTLENRLKISLAKQGCTRSDLIGKRYFGASEDRIKEGIKKMRDKRRGMKIDYPSNRNSPPCSPNKKETISKARLKTKEKYINMTDEEFYYWISQQSLYGPSGRKNGNVTRAIKWRGEEISKYYD